MYDELFLLTDKMVRNICKVHEKVRSQLDANKIYKQRGKVILDLEAERLIKESFNVLQCRTKKMYENNEI